MKYIYRTILYFLLVSILKYSSYESLKSFSFAQVLSEILTNFPFVSHLFCAMSLGGNEIKTKLFKRVQELIPRWCVLYSILLQSKDNTM